MTKVIEMPPVKLREGETLQISKKVAIKFVDDAYPIDGKEASRVIKRATTHWFVEWLKQKLGRT